MNIAEGLSTRDRMLADGPAWQAIVPVLLLLAAVGLCLAGRALWQARHRRRRRAALVALREYDQQHFSEARR